MAHTVKVDHRSFWYSRMKTFRTIALSSCITISVIIVVLSLVKWNERVGTLFSGGEETVYASGFSEFGFRSIKQGMSSNNVYELIGSPLRVVQQNENDKPSEIEWIYSDSSPTSKKGNFLIRIVVLDEQGVVKRKETGLYVD